MFTDTQHYSSLADYDHDEPNIVFGPPPTTNLIGKIKFKTDKAALFELAAVDPYVEYPEDFLIGGEKWLPLSQIKIYPLWSEHDPDPLPVELKDFVKINAPLWLVNKFKGQMKGRIEF